ncbi:MAG TPA: carbamoyltransferase C-terminal domain-containing protein [Acidimicrobiia bacterium]|nr:carbamoyltransferase C-terminal domain-containing protein [Acidimicrobiia bacterium]
MANVLGINAVFHDPSAALVVDGRVMAAAEEERFSRRKHGKRPLPFSAWELPEKAIAWCLESQGIDAGQLDAVAYSYDPARLPRPTGDPTTDNWEELRTLYAERLPHFLRTTFGTDTPVPVTYVPHHEAHAASAYFAAGYPDCAVLVVDGRGETTSSLTGWVSGGELKALSSSPLPHSLGLLYEELTEHLGFLRSSDEYKVMALASYGEPTHLEHMRRLVRFDDDGGFTTELPAWRELSPPVGDGPGFDPRAADLARSVQNRLEEVLLEAAHWLAETTGESRLALAGGVALNCVANTRLYIEGPFDEIWVQPAAGDAGTSLGAAYLAAQRLGDEILPMETAALGRSWSEDQIQSILDDTGVPYDRPSDIADAAAAILADDGVVGWFQGPGEFGPRALGHRSFLAHPGFEENVERMNHVKGRERFRPIAPIVTVERAGEIFADGPIPSPYMLFTHTVTAEWRARIPAIVHVDGTARIQTVDRDAEPLLHQVLTGFESRTGLPVLINTSFNTAGRPMVDHPAEALECMASSPIDAVALGPFLVRRTNLLGR